MEDVNIIYKSDIGLSFTWIRGPLEHINKINVVINDIVMHLSHEELIEFSQKIDISLKRKSSNCKDCIYRNTFTVIMLETPMPNLTFVKRYKDIKAIQDLIRGTLFELGLNSILEEVL